MQAVLPPNGKLVILGGGLAGAKAAEAARQQGFAGSVTLVAHEDITPYERPPLSKDYLQGKSDFAEAIVLDADWYGKNDVDLKEGVTATKIDREARTVTLSDGSQVSYDGLVLATGSRPKRPQDMDGADAKGVHVLRTKDDSDSLREAITDGTRVVVVGGGWIGMEAAASANILGGKVTVVIRDEVPFQKVLGREVGEYYAKLHAQHGNKIVAGSEVEKILTEDGRATGVQLTDGTQLPADVVLFGIGAAPNTEIAEEAGIEVKDGVMVDWNLRSLTDPLVFAVGDIAREDHPRWGSLRVEHWDAAMNQPAYVLRTMLGAEAPYDRNPYFFSDQFDSGMEYVGHVADPQYAKLVIRGSLDKGEFIAFWLDQRDHLLASMNVNIWDVVDEMIPYLTLERTVDPKKLADPDVELSKVGS